MFSTADWFKCLKYLNEPVRFHTSFSKWLLDVTYIQPQQQSPTTATTSRRTRSRSQTLLVPCQTKPTTLGTTCGNDMGWIAKERRFGWWKNCEGHWKGKKSLSTNARLNLGLEVESIVNHLVNLHFFPFFVAVFCWSYLYPIQRNTLGRDEKKLKQCSLGVIVVIVRYELCLLWLIPPTREKTEKDLTPLAMILLNLAV